jgi:hypothetical protein
VQPCFKMEIDILLPPRHLGDQECIREVLPVRSRNVDDVLSLLNATEQDLVIGR